MCFNTTIYKDRNVIIGLLEDSFSYNELSQISQFNFTVREFQYFEPLKLIEFTIHLLLKYIFP